MKIQDIITEDLVNPSIQDKKYSGTFKEIPSRDGPKKQIDAGTRASVKDDPNDPHMVIKHNRVPAGAKWDLYPRFITYLIDHHIENPHFPKVYDIKKITDAEGKFIYTYKLEKLISLGVPSKSELDAFIKNNFNKNNQFYQFYFSNIADGMPREQLIGVIFNELSRIDDGNIEDLSQELKSDTLIEAIGIIKNIMKHLSRGKSDIYEKNLMWRRGQYGLTLVFIDPI